MENFEQRTEDEREPIEGRHPAAFEKRVDLKRE